MFLRVGSGDDTISDLKIKEELKSGAAAKDDEKVEQPVVENVDARFDREMGM